MIRGQWSSADSLHPIACRIVCHLGGHYSCNKDELEEGSVLSLARAQRIRQLFWHSYILDKDLALHLERPPLLTRSHCDLSSQAQQENPEDIQFAMDLSCRAGLAGVKESVARLLYSPQALTASEGQLLSIIRQLDADLEQWRLSISPEVRPWLAPHPDHQFLLAVARKSEKVQSILLQLDYHYTLNHIHLPVRRCGRADGQRSLPEDLHSVIHSSIDLSTQASRSTLLSIPVLVELLKEAAWRQVFQFHVPLKQYAHIWQGTLLTMLRSLPCLSF